MKRTFPFAPRLALVMLLVNQPDRVGSRVRQKRPPAHRKINRFARIDPAAGYKRLECAAVKAERSSP